jgi:hypothetical protein
VSLLGEARRHYELRLALVARTTRTTTASWGTLDPSNLSASYQIAVLPELMHAVTVGQLAAARMTDPYVDRVLKEQNLDMDGPEVNARAFAGIASDGRPLGSLLASPMVDTQIRLRRGEGLERSMRSGLFSLERIVRTQIQDAGRAADGVAAVARKSVTGYYRYLTPPSCSRCAVLAGRFYKVNAGFLRHPRCDCVHVPGTKVSGDEVARDPRAYFESLSKEQQNRIFTNAGAEAIRDGADIGQVVNARRGMAAAGSRTTREGIRKFGAGRLTPEAIYAQTRTRAEARNLLVANGYLL